MGVLERGLSFAELGTQRRRWRRSWRRFGPRLGPRRGSRRRSRRGRASPGQAGGQGAWRAGTKRPRAGPLDSALARWLRPQGQGRAGLLQPAAPPALLWGLPRPSGAAAHFRRAQRKARGPGRAPGRSQGCHLGAARHLLRTSLSSSFWSSLLPPEVPSPFPKSELEKTLEVIYATLLHYL